MEPSPRSDNGPTSNPNGMGVQAPDAAEDSGPSALWDWGDFLDFAIDDQLLVSFADVDAIDDQLLVSFGDVDGGPTIHQQLQVSETEASTTPLGDRVRKRDPRLTCSNFLAGRVPCACPEIDEKLLEEEEPGKKRVRVAQNISWGSFRCQVPGCEADISELKEYHKRHRVCLSCANASSVTLDGVTKRYCQQCAKFHMLSDFDEGKRSCRRKLERHNNRRRQSRSEVHEPRAPGDMVNQGELQGQETACDGEAAKEGLVVVKDKLFESEDGHIPSLQSDPNSQYPYSNSGLSSGGAQLDGGREDSKFALSPSHHDNKGPYSTVCPTGRISFKLYNWNPAEFPRKLRNQIFQWLANMPIELEGYIRPGCTILTAFIAMPPCMWEKLFEDPISHLHELLVVPGKMLSKRGPVLVYLNNLIFSVTRDGSSVLKISQKGQAPRLHYVHPACFEAGKPIEFIACGSNLLQTGFRFLVSFAGKYLTCDNCVALPYGQVEGGSSLGHHLYKILICRSEPSIVGPAFIEPFILNSCRWFFQVENENGLSNFLPILIGDAEICYEMGKIEQKFRTSSLSISTECESCSSRQIAFSALLLDIAWSLKNPDCEKFQPIITPSWIKRFKSLLNFLLHYESTAILDKVHKNLRVIIDKSVVNNLVNGTGDADMRQLQECMDYSIDALQKKGYKSKGLAFQLYSTMQEGNHVSGSYSGGAMPSVAEFSSEDLRIVARSTTNIRSEDVPVMGGEVVTDMDLVKERPTKLQGHIFFRQSLIVIVALAVWFGVCAVLHHPREVGKLAVSIRRCVTDRF